MSGRARGLRRTPPPRSCSTRPTNLTTSALPFRTPLVPPRTRILACISDVRTCKGPTKNSAAEVMLITAYESDDRRPAVPDAARTAAHEDTCLYFGCPDVQGAYEELRRRGAPVSEPTVAPYGMKQLYFRDPDGFALCFQWPAKS